MTRRVLAAAGLLGLLLSAPRSSGEGTAAGPSPPVFGAGVALVRVDAIVLADGNRVVSDLAEADFEIDEDGQRQAPSLFLRRELPLSVVLMLDASASVQDRLAFTKAAAVAFIEALRPEDEASVVEFTDRVRVLQPATSDRAALRRAVDQVQAGGTTGLYNALYATLVGLPEGSSRDAELRRRAVVLLSDGEDTASLVWEEQVLELARRREAGIHVIDLRPRGEANRSARLLRALSDESGGEFHGAVATGELAAVYARVGEALRGQYTIGYLPSQPAAEGRWRRVEIRIRGRKGLSVRHRAGYYATP